jgi:gluconate 2-dehydrogenase gamma chain
MGMTEEIDSLGRPTHESTVSRVSPSSARWLTDEEYRLLTTLASLIVPSDELGPGAEEADVATRLDAGIASSSDRQAVYRSGLRSVQAIVYRISSEPLGDLPYPLQRAILTALESAYRKRHAGGASLHHRIQRKLRSWVYAWRGYTDAIVLFPILVADVLEAFYSSPIAWEWLGYDGPPLSRGWYVSVDSKVDHG